MKSVFSVLFCFFAVGSGLAWAASLPEAEQAYFQFNLAEAQSQYRTVLADENSPAVERADAARKLAAIESLIFDDLPAARSLLDQAEFLGAEGAETQLILSRLERQHGQFEAAILAAERAHALATSKASRRDAELANAQASLLQAQSILDREGKFNPGSASLEPALVSLDDLLEKEPGRPEAAKTALTLAVFLGDGPRALAAWRAYYRIPADGSSQGLLRGPAEALEEILTRWQGKVLTQEDGEKLFRALDDSRLFYEAALVQQLWCFLPPTSPRFLETRAYGGFLREVSTLTQRYYRAYAQGSGDQKEFQSDLDSLAEKLWDHLKWGRGGLSYSEENFSQKISQRFGGEWQTQKSNGHFGLHYGHRVIDEERLVQQYDKSATLRFVALDMMVSNGYASWFWDGRAQIGGWAGESRFVQIRPAYLEGGVQALRQITDPQIRANTEKSITEQIQSDEILALNNSCAYLPGLVERLTHQEFLRIWEGLASGGLSDQALRVSFIAEIDRLNLESGIFNHEGRHVIDKQDFFNFTRSESKREFRAKLSEVAFSDAPFLALCGGILAPNIGDGSAHGQANRKVIEGLVQWMERNARSIPNLDTRRPLLPQLDLLTAEQLRQACRDIDPAAS